MDISRLSLGSRSVAAGMIDLRKHRIRHGTGFPQLLLLPSFNADNGDSVKLNQDRGAQVIEIMSEPTDAVHNQDVAIVGELQQSRQLVPAGGLAREDPSITCPSS
jgi:hypothetical protein